MFIVLLENGAVHVMTISIFDIKNMWLRRVVILLAAPIAFIIISILCFFYITLVTIENIRYPYRETKELILEFFDNVKDAWKKR